MQNRAIALIDGYNFYHPIKTLQTRQKQSLLWLDYRSLLSYYVKRSRINTSGQLDHIVFFTAMASWRNKQNPGTTTRHQTYLNALKTSGITVVLGNFKEKRQIFPYQCPQSTTPARCRVDRIAHEEKETDVRIACKLLELAVKDKFDTCLLLSADSDLVPAIETLKTLYPEKRVILVTPPSKAKIDKLKRLSNGHISMGLKEIQRFQYPDVISTGNGFTLTNPFKTTLTTV
jgi:uncharacterized LabA/DUF88 family protein